MSKYLSDLSVLQWKSVGDIPDFPFSNYDDLVDAVNSNKFLLKLDNSKANAISPIILSRFSDTINIVISWLPYVIAFLSIIFGIISRKYLMILGAPLSIISLFLSRPYSIWGFPSYSKFPFSFLIVVGVVYYISGDSFIKGWNVLSLLIPFICGNYYYAKNLKEGEKAVMSDEPLFIYLYQQSSIELINTENGKPIFYHPDSDDYNKFLERQTNFDKP